MRRIHDGSDGGGEVKTWEIHQVDDIIQSLKHDTNATLFCCCCLSGCWNGIVVVLNTFIALLSSCLVFSTRWLPNLAYLIYLCFNTRHSLLVCVRASERERASERALLVEVCIGVWMAHKNSTEKTAVFISLVRWTNGLERATKRTKGGELNKQTMFMRMMGMKSKDQH